MRALTCNILFRTRLRAACAFTLIFAPLSGYTLEATATGVRDQAVLNSLGIRMESEKAAIVAVINEALARIALLEGRADTLEITANNLRSRLSLAETEINLLKSRAASLESRIATVQSDIATMKYQIANLQTRVANLESYVLWLNNRMTALEGADASARSRLAALESQLASLGARVTSLEARINPRELPYPNQCSGATPISNGSVWGCDVTVILNASSCGGHRCTTEQAQTATANRLCQQHGYSYATGIKTTYGAGCKSCWNAYWTGSGWAAFTNDNAAAIGSIGCFQAP